MEEGIVTVALMQAMEEAANTGVGVKVREVLARAGLEELVALEDNQPAARPRR